MAENQRSWWLADMNGDGADDLAFMEAGPQHSYNTRTLTVVVYLNRGDGYFGLSHPIPAGSIPYRYDLNPQAPPCAASDVEGNQRASIVCSVHTGGPSEYELLTFRLDRGVSGTYYSANGAPGILLGDVNADGKADVVIPVSTDTGYVSQLIAGISNGDGRFNLLGIPTDIPHPGWSKPSLIMVDINGDGRADVVAVEHDHNNRIIGIFDAISTSTFASPEQTQFDVHNATGVATGSWLNMLNPVDVIPARFDGTLNSGLILVAPRAGHNTFSWCARPIQKDHIELLRVSSNGDGSFTLPSGIDDCARTQELDVDASGGDIGTFFSSLAASFASLITGNPAPYTGRSGAPMDADGDGQTDVIVVGQAPKQDRPRITIAYTPPPATAALGWTPLNLPGDGRTAFARIDTSNSFAPQVMLIQPRQGPTFGNCLHKFTEFCAPYTFTRVDLKAPTETVMGIPIPVPLPTSVQENWHAVDLDGNCRPSWVYVDSSIQHVFPGIRFPLAAIMVAAYRPSDRGVGWSDTPIVEWFERDEGAVMGRWQIGDVTGDGRQGLIGVELGSILMIVHGITLDPDPSNPSGPQWSEHRNVIDRPAHVDGAWSIVDMNADHRSDLVQIASDGYNTGPVTIVNNIGTPTSTKKGDFSLAAASPLFPPATRVSMTGLSVTLPHSARPASCM
jgi:hypothetical protein